jgi:hypothetical protein
MGSNGGTESGGDPPSRSAASPEAQPETGQGERPDTPMPFWLRPVRRKK